MADDDAPEKLDEDRRVAFLAELRKMIQEAVLPALEAVRTNLEGDALRASLIGHGDSARLAVKVSDDLTAELSYSAPYDSTYRNVQVKLKYGRWEEKAQLAPNLITPQAVQKHVKALFRIMEDKPLGLGWASPD